MGLRRTVALSLLVLLFSSAGSPRPVQTPRVGAGEQAGFDAADKYLREQSFARACESFGKYLAAHGASPLAREAKVKRSQACDRAGRRTSAMYDEQRAIADGGPLDLGRALANLWLHQRGERWVGNDSEGRWKIAVSQLEALAAGAGGRWAQEARSALIAGLFVEIERNPSSERAAALAEKVLAQKPGAEGRARAIYARGRARLHDERHFAAARKDLLLAGAGKTEWADDALWALASHFEDRQQFVEALTLYDQMVERFSATTSNRRSDAVNRAEGIRRPRLGLQVSMVELPGALPQAQLSLRNLEEARLTLRRADPFGERDAERMLSGGSDRAGKAGEEIRSWTERLKAPAPHVQSSKGVVVEVPGPGVYLLEAVAGKLRESVPVLVTPYASVVKLSRNQVAVWTVDAVSGAAAAGAEVVAFVEVGGQHRRLEGRSDAGGLCLLEVKEGDVRNAAAWSRKGDGYAFARAHTSYYAYGSKEVLAYVLTDRPLYKPGERVGVKLFLRSREGGPSLPLPGAAVRLTVHDPSGRDLKTEELTTSEFGTAGFELELGKDAQLGAYSFYLRSDKLSLSQSQGRFRVEEYKPPEYTVSVEPVGKPRPDETVKVKVSASFFFGGPVANAQGRAVVTEQSWAHQWKPWADEGLDGSGSDGYGGGHYRGRRHYGHPWNYRPAFSSKTLQFKTDAAGEAILELEPTRDPAGDRSFQVQVFVTDASRREITGSASINASAAPWFVDLRTERVIYKPGERIAVKLRAEDANGRPESGEVEVRLLRLGQGGKSSQVLARRAKIQGGAGLIELDADAIGPARVEVRPVGAADGEVLSSCDLWLTDDARPIVPETQGFQVITDRAPLKVGGTVRALVVTPGAGGHVLVSIEGSRIHSAASLAVQGRARFVELPLSAAMTPNAFLFVSRLEGLQYHSRQAPVRVSGSDTELDVAVLFPKLKTEPGTSLPVRVAVKGRDRTPRQTEVSVTLVDEAIYRIEPERQDFLSFFGRSAQRLAVSTVASLHQWSFNPKGLKPREQAEPTLPPPQPLVAADAPTSAASGMALDERSDDGMMQKEEAAPRMRSAKKAAGRDAESPSKAKADAGPGGGEAEPVKARSNFSSSAGWFPALWGPSPGSLLLEATFPDSLTSWKATAVAVTAGPEMGVGSGTVRTEKDLMVRLQGPRFFTERDEVTLSAIVNSRMPTNASVEVVFEAPGLKPLGELTQRVELLPGGEARVEVRFLVVEPGERKVKVTARSRDAADAMEWTLPALVHGAAQRQAFSGRLADKVVLAANLPERRNPGGTRFELTVSPSLVSVMLDALPYLAQYPYGCVEQTLSRFVPAAIAAKTVRELGLPSTRVPADLDDMVQAGLKRLYGFQHGDGGWGWWQADGTNRWMSAYVVYGLSLGQAAGLQIDKRVLERGRSYLIGELGAAQRDPETHAFMVFALSSTGSVPKKALDKAFRNRTRLSRRGRALVALALESAKDRRARIAVENLDDIVVAAQGRADASAGPANDIWETSEAIEATAFALMAIYRHDPNAALVRPLTDFLVLRRNGGKWRNTRDTAFALYALAELAGREKAASSSGSLTVLVNGKEAGRVKYSKGGMDLTGPVVLSDEAFRTGANSIEIRRDGAGTAYYAATWDVFNQNENLKGVGGDVRIARSYTVLGRPGAAKAAPGSMEYGMMVESGERVRVEVEVTANKAVEYLMIEDFKPAGLEAVLQKSGPEVCGYHCAHAELRTDRVAMFLTQLKVGKTKLAYELRAEVPGRFHTMPARIEAMYAPEIQATSDEMRLEVRDAAGPLEGVATQE